MKYYITGWKLNSRKGLKLMKNDVQVFQNDVFGSLRTVDEDGKIMFVASDVAKMLGYTNPSKAISDHCKGVTKRYNTAAKTPRLA